MGACRCMGARCDEVHGNMQVHVSMQVMRCMGACRCMGARGDEVHGNMQVHKSKR